MIEGGAEAAAIRELLEALARRIGETNAFECGSHFESLPGHGIWRSTRMAVHSLGRPVGRPYLLRINSFCISPSHSAYFFSASSTEYFSSM